MEDAASAPARAPHGATATPEIAASLPRNAGLQDHVRSFEMALLSRTATMRPRLTCGARPRYAAPQGAKQPFWPG
jgi:hypothetical protein